MAAEASLRDRRSRLLAEPGLTGEEFCRRYADEADAWLSDLAERAAGDSQRHLALVAVGGYGRRALCPYSDLDVVLVHDGHRDIGAVADAIWYPVWDEGVHLDHSVRRPDEVLSAAAEDVRVALGLLDGRLVWGEPKVAEPLLEKARAAWRDRLGTQYLPLLEVQMDAATANTAGDVAFLLEPDLKESHGGLRDVSVLRAISAYAPLLADYADLASLDEADGAADRHPGRAAPHGPARARQAPAPGPGPGGGPRSASPTPTRHAGGLDRGAPDRLGERRRVAAAAALGPDSPTEAPLPPRRPRGAAASAPAVDLGPDMAEVDGEIALTPIAPVSTTRRCRCGWPPRPPSSTSRSPRARCTGWPTGCRRPATPGRPRPAMRSSALLGAGPAGRRQARVARPARPVGAPHPRVVRRAQQAATQRLPHLHRGPASARGGGAGGAS